MEWPGGRLDFTSGPLVMGILNVTPDSFSDGGMYFDTDRAVEHGLAMARAGAAILDIGAESTRPGSKSVSSEEQIKRAVPVIRRLFSRVNIPISIDTKDPQVAQAAADAGAAILNDITALTDDRMKAVAVRNKMAAVLMHMRGDPETMQAQPQYDDVVVEVSRYLLEKAEQAQAAGLPAEHIILDPGIGFGKTTEHNLSLLKHLNRLVESGYPVLVGTSRKRFIGQITGRDKADERTYGTAATVALAVAAGAKILRVHDVSEMIEVIKIAWAVKTAP